MRLLLILLLSWGFSASAANDTSQCYADTPELRYCDDQGHAYSAAVAVAERIVASGAYGFGPGRLTMGAAEINGRTLRQLINSPYGGAAGSVDREWPEGGGCSNRPYETGWEGGGTAAVVNVCNNGCMYESSLDATATSGIGYSPTGKICTTNDAPEPTPATPGGGDDGGGTGGETGGGGDSGSGGDGGGDNGSGGDGGSGGGDGGGGDGDGDGNSDGGGDGDGDGDGTGENPSLPENPTYPGDVPMPYADPPIPSSYLGQWSSGLGGGSCPAPRTISASVGGYDASVTFEFTPLCDFSRYIRGMVIAFAAIVAAYIVAGLRR